MKPVRVIPGHQLYGATIVSDVRAALDLCRAMNAEREEIEAADSTAEHGVYVHVAIPTGGELVAFAYDAEDAA